MSDGETVPPPAPDLLSCLDRDPERAEAICRELRRQLVKFLQWNHCRDAEEAAQETLARGFRRIAEGADVTAEGPRAYFFGIAKNLVREGWRRTRKETRDAVVPDWRSSPARHADQIDARLTLKHYLSQLSAAERALIIRYHTEDREQLVCELGINAAALRQQVHRISVKLWALRAGSARPGKLGGA